MNYQIFFTHVQQIFLHFQIFSHITSKYYFICLFSSGYTSYQVPDTFLMVLDLEQGTLAFIGRGQYLGVAHTGLRGKTLYPVVSSVWGHCEVTYHSHRIVSCQSHRIVS